MEDCVRLEVLDNRLAFKIISKLHNNWSVILNAFDRTSKLPKSKSMTLAVYYITSKFHNNWGILFIALEIKTPGKARGEVPPELASSLDQGWGQLVAAVRDVGEQSG